MMNVKLTMRALLFIALILFSVTSFAMFCPSNFNNIDVGDSMGQIIESCGLPDEQSEYKETVTGSVANSDAQPNQQVNQPSNDVIKKVIVHTKLIYLFPQHAALLFENGVLKDREFIR